MVLGSIHAGGPGVLYTHDLVGGSILTIPTTVPLDVRWGQAAPAHWTLSVTVTAPGGKPVGYRDLTAGDEVTPEAYIEQAEPGVYEITASGRWEDADHAFHDFVLSPSSFTMRRPRSRVDVKASDATPRMGQLIRVRGAVWGEGPSGDHAVLDARVTVEQRARHRWRPVKTVKLARWNTYVARFPYRGRGSALRVVARAPGYDYSVSRIIRMRPVR